MMTLDEAIEHAKEKAKEQRYYTQFENGSMYHNCSKCAEEHEQLAEWLEELKECKQLEEQSLSLKLPCEVNSIVYLVDKRFATSRRRPMQCYINEYIVDKFGCHAVLSGNEMFYMLSRFTSVNIVDFGKTVFLTREKAEKELERLER